MKTGVRSCVTGLVLLRFAAHLEAAAVTTVPDWMRQPVKRDRYTSFIMRFDDAKSFAADFALAYPRPQAKFTALGVPAKCGVKSLARGVLRLRDPLGPGRRAAGESHSPDAERQGSHDARGKGRVSANCAEVNNQPSRIGGQS